MLSLRLSRRTLCCLFRTSAFFFSLEPYELFPRFSVDGTKILTGSGVLAGSVIDLVISIHCLVVPNLWTPGNRVEEGELVRVLDLNPLGAAETDRLLSQ